MKHKFVIVRGDEVITKPSRKAVEAAIFREACTLVEREAFAIDVAAKLVYRSHKGGWQPAKPADLQFIRAAEAMT